MAAERQRARHAKAGGQKTRRMERKSQSGRQHSLRRTGTCRRELAGRIRTDTRPAPSPRPGHHDHVRGSRSAPVQRRQRPHGAARHELHVERARFEPNYHSNGLPGRLPAAPEGVEPQSHRRTAHKCLEPRAALVCSLRLFATASAIARIAFALQCLSRGSAQLQIAFSDREAGRLSRRRLTRVDSGALAVSVRKLPSSANSRAPADMLRAWLATDWHRIRDPYWWFSAVAVGIAASIIAGHLKQFIDRKFAGYSAAPK